MKKESVQKMIDEAKARIPPGDVGMTGSLLPWAWVINLGTVLLRYIDASQQAVEGGRADVCAHKEALFVSSRGQVCTNCGMYLPPVA